MGRVSVIRNVDPARREEILARVRDLAARLRRELGATRVLLYGSFASDRVHEGSDVDLVVVAPLTGKMHERIVRVFDLTDLPVEPLVYTPEEFERRRADPTSMVAEALRTGVDL
jgi:predicted nucleotidyltransferase